MTSCWDVVGVLYYGMSLLSTSRIQILSISIHQMHCSMLSVILLAANGFQLKGFLSECWPCAESSMWDPIQSKLTEGLQHFYGIFIQACQHSLSDNCSQGKKKINSTNLESCHIASVEVIMSQTHFDCLALGRRVSVTAQIFLQFSASFLTLYIFRFFSNNN